MHPALRENRVFRVHQLVEQYAQGVRVVFGGVRRGEGFEFGVVEVGDVAALTE